MRNAMIILGFLLWCCLLVLCWPLAFLAAVLLPVVWLLALPFRMLGLVVEALFALIRTLLFIPGRVLGYRRKSA